MRKSLLILCTALSGCAGIPRETVVPNAPSAAPAAPASAALASDFYARRREVGGVRIAGSAKVSEAALDEAAKILTAMTADRPGMLGGLAARKVGIAVIATGEFTTDLPERAAMRPRRYHDLRRRASGATPETPVITVGEENLLGFRGDPDAGRALLTREIGRSVLTLLRHGDAATSARLAEAHALFLKKRPPGDPGPTPSREDYWGDGVMAWFDAGNGPDRDGLKRADPALATLVGDVFGDGVTRVAPAKTMASPDTPVFTVPEEFKAWEARFRRGEETLAAPGTTILAAYPPGLHRSMRPRYMAEWRSPETPGVATSIHFVNVSDASVRIDLIDSSGKAVAHGTLDTGGHLDVKTTYGAVWRIADPLTAKALSYAVAEAEPGQRIIMNPEEEEEEFLEEGEYEPESPFPITLRPASERDRWSSYESEKETSVCFDNRSSRTLIVHAVDRNGNETRIDRLRPGDDITLATLADQVWRISDESGKTLGYACSLRRHAIMKFSDETTGPR